MERCFYVCIYYDKNNIINTLHDYTYYDRDSRARLLSILNLYS